MKITLKELLDFEFTTNENGKMIALVPLSKVNEIADILTNQKEKIDKASEDLGKIIDHLNNKTIISLYHFTHQLEIIQDELVGGNDE